jgi:hypothetical protein
MLPRFAQGPASVAVAIAALHVYIDPMTTALQDAQRCDRVKPELRW